MGTDMIKEHKLMGWAQLIGGIAGLLFFMMSYDLKYPVLIYALVFLAMGYQHIVSQTLIYFYEKNALRNLTFLCK